MTATPRPGKPPDVPKHQPSKMEAYYLLCLKTWMRRMKRPPWVRELAGWLGCSYTAVYSALISLEHKGWVCRTSDVDDEQTGQEGRRFIPREFPK